MHEIVKSIFSRIYSDDNDDESPVKLCCNLPKPNWSHQLIQFIPSNSRARSFKAEWVIFSRTTHHADCLQQAVTHRGKRHFGAALWKRCPLLDKEGLWRHGALPTECVVQKSKQESRPLLFVGFFFFLDGRIPCVRL